MAIVLIAMCTLSGLAMKTKKLPSAVAAEKHFGARASG